MSRSREKPLADHLPARASGDRIARQWEALAGRLPSRPRTRSTVLVWALAVSALTMGAAVFAFRLDRAPLVANAPADNEILMLPDGSRGVLEPATRIAVAAAAPEHVLLVLEAGGIHLEVPRSDTRTFIVRAAGYDATVLGTAFRVRVDKREGREVIEVGVTQGSVKISRSDHSVARILRSGETWTETVESKPAPSTVMPPASGAVPTASNPINRHPAPRRARRVSRQLPERPPKICWHALRRRERQDV